MELVSPPIIADIKRSQLSDVQLCLLWILVTAIPAIVGWIFLSAVINSQVSPDPEVSLQNDNGILPAIEFFCGMWLIGGLTLSVAQSLVLRSRFALSSGNQLFWVAGWMVSMIATVFTLGTINTGNSTSNHVEYWLVIPGTILGVMQWFVLQSVLQLNASTLWIAACGVGWVMAALVGKIVFNALFQTAESKFGVPYYPTEAMWAWNVAWTSGVLFFSVLTGICMAWIAKRYEAERRAVV